MTKTVEIMGGNLELVIQELGVIATKTYETNNEQDYYINYQVWELDETELLKLESCEDWKSEYGWYRNGEAFVGITKDFVVNGNKMLGMYEEDNLYETTYTDDDELIHLDPREKVHELKNIAQYYYEYLGISTEYNFVYFTKSLAELNKMKVSEFVKTYY